MVEPPNTTFQQLDDVAASFIGWQCRLRQYVVRRSDGRPSPGMCPGVVLPGGDRIDAIVTVLVKAEPAHAIAEFRHIVSKTNDPHERYEAAIRALQTVYYQYPREFSDELTALFSIASASADALLGAGQCTLDYAQANQRFVIPCAVRSLAPEEPAYRATFWHNAMFNPKLSAPVTVLQFVPDWVEALAQTT